MRRLPRTLEELDAYQFETKKDWSLTEKIYLWGILISLIVILRF